MTDQTPVTFPWRTDFENAPSPCIGWCTPPAGDDVRQIWRHSHLKGQWTAHSITQTVKAWQPLPSIGIDGGVAQTSGWQPIKTAPRGDKIVVARKGGQRDDGSTYWYEALGHFSLMGGVFHKSYGELYGEPELWAPYPLNPEHCSIPSTDHSAVDAIAERSPGVSKGTIRNLLDAELCDDCPPRGYPTDKTRCRVCPRVSSNHPREVGK